MGRIFSRVIAFISCDEIISLYHISQQEDSLFTFIYLLNILKDFFPLHCTCATNPSTYQSIYLPIHLLTYPSTYLSTHTPIYTHTHPTYLPTYLPTHLPTNLPTYPSIHPPTHLPPTHLPPTHLPPTHLLPTHLPTYLPTHLHISVCFYQHPCPSSPKTTITTKTQTIAESRPAG